MDAVAAGGAAAPEAPASKRAAKRARAAAGGATAGCRSWVAVGSCKFGDKCKFGHGSGGDGENAPPPPPLLPSLPGRCPFAATVPAPCPHGDTCRWAASHGDTSAVDTAAAEAVVAAMTAPPPDGAPIALAPLPTVQPAVNTLPRSLRDALRDGAHGFGRANAALTAAGVNTAHSDGAAARARARARAARRAERKEDGGGDAAAGAAGAAGAADAAVAAPVLLFDAAAANAGAPPAAFTHPTTLSDPPPYTETRLLPSEKRRLDFKDALYLAPLTTVGNLPFRALCVGLGADVTCGEMALATSLMAASPSEWALVKRHPSERLFGVQLAGGHADAVARAAQAVGDACADGNGNGVDFFDLNCGCPIDLVTGKGAGSALLTKPGRIETIIRCVDAAVDAPVTLKVRKGWADGKDCVHEWLPRARAWGAAAVTVHGRSRQQRYSRAADWGYVQRVADAVEGSGLQVIGSGDVASFTEFEAARAAAPSAATAMLARGALIKPWLFTEIKERRHWDISAGERLALIGRFASLGLTHWGADARGVETTRRYLLEWLSFAHRYVPAGLLDVGTPSAKLAWRPPPIVGRNDLETLLASPSAADWVRVTELVLGPPPPGFRFAPKHKSNAYSSAATLASGEGEE